MITRISKIARLPHATREQLNHRLQNGQMGRTIVKWLNDLPETKETITEYFDGKPITHQNLSEWRRTGYQDWLLHQDRLLWYERLSEQETEIEAHNHSGDGFETMGSLFLYEIGQALTAMQQIRNPHDRCNRLETLAREFARLQNAFNWSRRVQLEYDKHNANHPTSTRATPPPVSRSAGIPACGFSGLSSPESQTPTESPSKTLKPVNSQTPVEERQSAGALLDAPRKDQRASVPDCDSPLPLPESNSLTPKLPNSQTPNNLQPNPTPATPTPSPHQITPHFLEEINKIRKTRNSYPAPRQRRFVCIEG